MSPKRISAILTVLSLFLFTCLVAPNAQAVTYSFTTIDTLGIGHTYPNSINASGQVAGSYLDGSGREHVFVYSGSTLTILDVPGATQIWGTSINDSGQATASYQDSLDKNHGLVYSNGTFTILDAPGAIYTEAADINTSGQVTGFYGDNSATAHAHGFVYSNGTFTTLDVPGAVGTLATSISDSGQVAGIYLDGSRAQHGIVKQYGFVYSNGAFTTLNVPGVVGTSATSINDSGQVIGTYSDSPFDQHGFLYSNGTFTTLDVPDATRSWVTSINDSGQVTGYYRDSFASHGFVYSNGTFTTLDVPDATDTYVTSINDSGQVTGYFYRDNETQHGFIATPVCETPTVTIHTLITAPQGEFKITGSIAHEGAPLCALVLANGQSMFTCGDPLPKGDFDLTVPPDDQGKITLFGFAADLVPYQQTFGPDALPASANATVNATSCAIPRVTYTTTAAPQGKFRLTGSITQDDAPLCALVLANGQSMFTCGDPLGKGSFDLTVPPDDQGQITLFGFVAGLEPFQQTFSPAPSTPP